MLVRKVTELLISNVALQKRVTKQLWPCPAQLRVHPLCGFIWEQLPQKTECAGKESMEKRRSCVCRDRSLERFRNLLKNCVVQRWASVEAQTLIERDGSFVVSANV